MGIRAIRRLLTKRSKGWLSIEMGIVIAVVGLFATVAVVGGRALYANAQETALKAEVDGIFTLMAQRIVANRSYGTNTDLEAELIAAGELPDSTLVDGQFFVSSYETTIVAGDDSTVISTDIDAAALGISASKRGFVFTIYGVDQDDCNILVDASPRGGILTLRAIVVNSGVGHSGAPSVLPAPAVTASRVGTVLASRATDTGSVVANQLHELDVAGLTGLKTSCNDAGTSVSYAF